jgi:hypothetical protein
VAPAIPELREAVEQDDQWAVAGLDVVQSRLGEVGVAVAQLDVVNLKRERAGLLPPGRISWM